MVSCDTKCCLCINKDKRFVCKICDTKGYLLTLSKKYVKRATGKSTGTGNVEKYLKCDMIKLKKHLEGNFTNGMSWINHGVTWQIDHSIPLFFKNGKCKSSIKDRTERLVYTNMKPLSVEENLSKGCRYTS